MESTPEELITFGRSLIVPSVQDLAKAGPDAPTVPARYVRPSQDFPAAVVAGDGCIPVIDVQSLVAGEDSAVSELQKLHSACKQWGFFQVVNHGVSASLLQELKSETQRLFALSSQEKKQLWQQPDNHEGFGQLFVVSETQKLDWSDMFYLTTLPVNLRNTELFRKLPPTLRLALEAYCEAVKKLAMCLLTEMARALKMEAEEVGEMFRDGVQSVRMNYYPPCPQPDATIGLSPHSDADALTVLFQLNDTQGLQIRNEGKWVHVKPLPNALVVNIGDIMEILSNGIYRSVEHRAAVNSVKERLSVATFYSPRLDLELGPASSLLGPHCPPAFRRVPLEKYFKEFFARRLEGKSYLDFMRIGFVEESGTPTAP